MERWARVVSFARKNDSSSFATSTVGSRLHSFKSTTNIFLPSTARRAKRDPTAQVAKEDQKGESYNPKPRGFGTGVLKSKADFLLCLIELLARWAPLCTRLGNVSASLVRAHTVPPLGFRHVCPEKPCLDHHHSNRTERSTVSRAFHRVPPPPPTALYSSTF